jgi:isocitrate lyase
MKNLEQSNYSSALQTVRDLKAKYGTTWDAISPESAARMATQNRFKTGLDIAKYTAIMRKDMADYDANASITRNHLVWHGFVAQQNIIAVKKHHKTTSKRYIYLSGWMVAACVLNNLPDQSMHENNSSSID